MINIKESPYCAVGDGVYDDTSAIQCALDHLELNGGGSLYFPKGIYKVSDQLFSRGHGVTIFGENRKSTTIKTCHPTSNILNIIGWDNKVHSIGFDSSVPRTGGIFVNMLGVRSILEDFDITNDFIGISMIGTASRIYNGFLHTGAANGTRVFVGGGDTSQIIDNILIGAQDAPYPAYGIRVQDSAALVLTNSSVLTAGICLAIIPSSGEGTHSLYASNCFFDSSSTGIMIAPTGSGNVSRLHFIGCWTGGHTGNGVDIRKSPYGSTNGIHFTQHDALNNGLSGISVGSGVGDFTLNGGEIAGNAHGVYIAEGCFDWSVLNATIGEGGGMVKNRGFGVFVSNYCNRYMISNNRMVNNISGACNRVTDQFGIVTNNIG